MTKTICKWTLLLNRLVVQKCSDGSIISAAVMRKQAAGGVSSSLPLHPAVQRIAPLGHIADRPTDKQRRTEGEWRCLDNNNNKIYNNYPRQNGRQRRNMMWVRGGRKLWGLPAFWCSISGLRRRRVGLSAGVDELTREHFSPWMCKSLRALIREGVTVRACLL